MVSQRSSGHRPPTLDEGQLARLSRATPTEPPPFPCELSRCRCGTPSFDPAAHAAPCPLGLTPPLSTNPVGSADRVPEWQRGF